MSAALGHAPDPWKGLRCICYQETLLLWEDSALRSGQGTACQDFTSPRELPSARTKPMDRPEGAAHLPAFPWGPISHLA